MNDTDLDLNKRGMSEYGLSCFVILMMINPLRTRSSRISNPDQSRRPPYVDLTLGRRRRRWTNVKSTWGERVRCESRI